MPSTPSVGRPDRCYFEVVKFIAFGDRNSWVAGAGIAPQLGKTASYRRATPNLGRGDIDGRKEIISAFNSSFVGHAPTPARVRQACHR